MSWSVNVKLSTAIFVSVKAEKYFCKDVLTKTIFIIYVVPIYKNYFVCQIKVEIVKLKSNNTPSMTQLLIIFYIDLNKSVTNDKNAIFSNSINTKFSQFLSMTYYS